MFGDLRAAERSVYSQGGADGILERIFETVGTTNRFFVEFGAKDGVELSNTAYLRLERGWSGLLMEGETPVVPGVVNEFVTAENIEDIFSRRKVPERFDLLSIDIDGNDYWVWKALQRFRPRAVVIEYNIHFQHHEAWTVPYDPERHWDKSGYHGASLAALQKLGKQKGYSLIYTDSWVPNAFFVLSELLTPELRDLPVANVAGWTLDSQRPPDPEGRPWIRV